MRFQWGTPVSPDGVAPHERGRPLCDLLLRATRTLAPLGALSAQILTTALPSLEFHNLITQARNL